MPKWRHLSGNDSDKTENAKLSHSRARRRFWRLSYFFYGSFFEEDPEIYRLLPTLCDRLRVELYSDGFIKIFLMSTRTMATN